MKEVNVLFSGCSAMSKIAPPSVRIIFNIFYNLDHSNGRDFEL
jgi:hypothetical protein